MYSECCEQHLTIGTSITGINHLAIDSVMDDFGITEGSDRIAIRREVKRLFNKVNAVKVK